MDINNFEERIKIAFEQHRLEADTDTIWENIEPQLKKKKKRRAIIWFFSGLGLAFLLLFVGRHEWQHTSSSIHQTSTSLPLEKVGQGRAAKAPAQEKTVAAPSVSTKQANVQHINLKKTVLPPSTITAGSANSIAKKLTELETINSKEITLNNSNIINTNTELVIRETNALLPLASLPLAVIHRDSVPDTSILQELGRNLEDNNKIDKDKKEKIADRDEQTTPEKPVHRKKSKKLKSPWTYNLGMQAGPALAIKHLSERSDATAPVGHLKKRQTTEHTLESYTIGMFYSATHRRLVLKTGLNYRQSNEKFRLAYNKTETENINGVLSVTVDNAGTIIEQTTGNKTVIKTTEYSNTAYNHYHFINWPVGVGYRHTSTRSGWELSGGMDINLLFRADGTMYNRYNLLTTIKPGSTTYGSIFRSHNGVGLWAEYAYDWRMTDQLCWQLSANAQVPLHPVSAADYVLVQRYFNFGVQVGVVYEIKKPKKGK